MTTFALPKVPKTASAEAADGGRHRPTVTKPWVLTACVCAAVVPLVAPIGLPLIARATISVFAVMLICSGFTKISEMRLAVAAVGVLVAIGASSVGDVASEAVGGTMWLLVASFVVAAAAAATGLAERLAVVVAGSATTVRSLFWRVNAMLIVTAFLVPSTAGRAALMVPVFHALAAHIESPRVRRGLAVMFPVGILLSAVASLLGAGAHIVTAEFVSGLGGQRLDMVRWATLGVPFAAASCIAAQAVVLRLFVGHDHMAVPLDLSQLTRPAVSGAQRFTLAVMVTLVAVWLTESVHGVPAWLAAVVAAVLLTAPLVGVVAVRGALGQVPWEVLVLMVATVEVGTALARTGAADWMATSLLGPVVSVFGGGVAIVGAIAVLSLMSHLVITSRTARASVLIPVVVLVGGAANLDLTAVAFLSSAAAGYCLSSTASAKPMLVFSRVGQDAYAERDLRRLSLRLAPIQFGLLLGFAYLVWPALGMALHRDAPADTPSDTPTVGRQYPWEQLVVDDLGFGPRWDPSPVRTTVTDSTVVGDLPVPTPEPSGGVPAPQQPTGPDPAPAPVPPAVVDPTPAGTVDPDPDPDDGDGDEPEEPVEEPVGDEPGVEPADGPAPGVRPQPGGGSAPGGDDDDDEPVDDEPVDD